MELSIQLELQRQYATVYSLKDEFFISFLLAIKICGEKINSVTQKNQMDALFEKHTVSYCTSILYNKGQSSNEMQTVLNLFQKNEEFEILKSDMKTVSKIAHFCFPPLYFLQAN